MTETRKDPAHSRVGLGISAALLAAAVALITQVIKAARMSRKGLINAM